jgi:hypothetical protein
MIWHLLLKPMLKLLGNLFGFRPDIDDDQAETLEKGTMFFLLWLCIPATIAVTMWALLWA